MPELKLYAFVRGSDIKSSGGVVTDNTYQLECHCFEGRIPQLPSGAIVEIKIDETNCRVLETNLHREESYKIFDQLEKHQIKENKKKRNYTKMIQDLDPEVKKVACRAYVNFVSGRTIHAYSPIFEYITVDLQRSDYPERYRRGDIISIKPYRLGYSLVAVENLEQNVEVENFKKWELEGNFSFEQQKRIAAVKKENTK